MEKYARLEKNIIEIIKEAQFKLGYESHPMSLNYPLRSLCHLTGEYCGEKEMMSILKEFLSSRENIFGVTAVTVKEGIFTLTISASGVDFVHGQTSENEFLSALINAVRSHSGYEEIREIFFRYSHNVTEKQAEDNSGEYDYLLYFEDGKPDEFYYLMTLDMGHVSYHRLTKEDYADLFEGGEGK